MITESKTLGATYKEWAEEKKGASWKSVVKKDINAAVKKAATYDDFLRIMKDLGYQTRGEDLNAASPKYISFLPPGKDRWIRGKETTLGPDYTRESINRRIESGSAMDMNDLLHPENDRLIQISEEKLADSPYLKRWADQKNLQIASAAYTEIKRAGFSSLEDLSSHIAKLRSQISTLRDTAMNADRKMSPLPLHKKTHRRNHHLRAPQYFSYQNPDAHLHNPSFLYTGVKNRSFCRLLWYAQPSSPIKWI